MEKAEKSIACLTALALAWASLPWPAFAQNVRFAAPARMQVAGSMPIPMGRLNISAPGSAGVLPSLISPLGELKFRPITSLERLKASHAPLEFALDKARLHPAAVSERRKSLSALLGPESFKALAATVLALNKLADKNSPARGLLSSAGNPAALGKFKARFDGAALQASDGGDSGAILVLDFSGDRPPRSGLSKPAASNPSDSPIDRRLLSLAEKIAQGITQDEGLRLVPWEPLWEGDRPTWRLIKEGDLTRVQYVPEDLRHGSQEVVMAHFMQEIFRAVYSRPDLIEPELKSNSLFQTLYDAMETGRVVEKGLKERPGLAGGFKAFNQEQYGDPKSQEAAQRMKNLPGYLRFLEGALYESRQGREDPRIKDPRILKALKNTRPSRRKIAAASSEEASKLIRKIWPLLQKLYAESEDAAVSQKLFEKLGQEGRLGLGRGQNAAAGQGRLKLEDLDKQRREQIKKELDEFINAMSAQERDELRRQAQQEMRRQEQAFRQTMGKSQERPQDAKSTGDLARQLEQAASRLVEDAAHAENQARDLQEDAAQLRAQTGARSIDPKEAEELDGKAAELHEQAARLNQSAQEFRRLAERLKSGASSAAAEDTLQQARELDRMGKDLQDQSRRLQGQTQALKKQLDEGQAQKTSPLRQKAAGIEETAGDIAEKAGQIQGESKNAQALAEALGRALAGSQGAPESQGKSSQESATSKSPSEPDSAPSLLEQMIAAWSQEGSSENPEQPGDSGDAQDGPASPDGDRSSNGQGRGSGRMTGLARNIERIKSGGLDAEQRRYLDEFLQPIRAMIDTLASKIRKYLRVAILGRSLSGLYQGDIDEDALPFYRVPGVGIMKEELLPGRRKTRLTMLIDLSGSMNGLIYPEHTLYHAVRALVLGLKALQKAFKNQQGIEVRVVGYNGTANIPLLAYSQAKDITDAVIHQLIKTIDKKKGGATADIKTMQLVAADIREDMRRRPDTTYAVLHMGDGNPENNEVAEEVTEIYQNAANAKIRFGNLAAGPGAGKMYEDYKPHSFLAEQVQDLGIAWARMIEAVFKKSWSGNRS